MVNHHVITHGGIVGCGNHRAVICGVDGRSLGSRQIHSVVELRYPQNRVDSVSVFTGHPGIGCQRELKGAAIVGQNHTAGCQKGLLLFRHKRFQRCYFFLFCLDGSLVFPDCRFLHGNIILVTVYFLILLRNQYLQIPLLFLHRSLGLIQNLFLNLELFLTELHILPGVHIVLPASLVIVNDSLRIICFVQEITEALRLQKHIRHLGIARFIHHPDACNHRFLLILFLGKGLLQFLLRGFYLDFLLRNLLLQYGDIMLNLFQIAVQLFDV